MRLGEEVIRSLRALALYVELNCKDDLNTFLTSGFQPRSSTRTAALPLDQPIVVSIDQGVSGELLVSIKSVRRAKHYDLRCGPVGPRRRDARFMVDPDGAQCQDRRFNQRTDARYDVCNSGTCVRSARLY